MKINKKDNLRAGQFNKIVNNKHTVNLLNKEETQRQYNKLYFAETSRLERIKKAKLNKRSIIMTFLLSGLLIILVGSNILSSNAFETEIDSKVAQTKIDSLKTHLNEFDVEERAFETITKFEGYHDKPYWDYKQWSCGYGMKCNKDTIGITKEKSKAYVIERIVNIRDRYNLYRYNDNIEIALISFVYNIGSLPAGTERYIDNGYINALKNKMKQYVYAGNTKLRGLEIRREYECNLF